MAGGEYLFNVTTAMLSFPEYQSGDLPMRMGLAAWAASVVMDTIKAGWPVLTAKSLGGFRRELSTGAWFIRNDVDYTSYVGSRQGTTTPLVMQLQAVGLRKVKAGIAARKRFLEAQVGLVRTRVSSGRLGARAAAVRKARVVRDALNVVGPTFQRTAVAQGISASRLAVVEGLVRRSRFDTAARELRRLGLPQAASEIERLGSL